MKEGRSPPVMPELVEKLTQEVTLVTSHEDRFWLKAEAPYSPASGARKRGVSVGAEDGRKSSGRPTSVEEHVQRTC